MQVPTGRTKSGEHIGVVQLIPHDSEYHQNNIEMPLEVDTANISLMENHFVVTQESGSLSPSLGEHTFGAIHSRHFVTSLGQRKGMVACSTSQVKNAADNTIAVGSENALEEIALSRVVLVLIRIS